MRYFGASKKQDADVIVIGSGLGGLTSASLLSQYYGRKVLVFEKHSKLGGLTHTFGKQNGRYRFDVGVHYVGEMEPGNPLRRVFDTVTEGRLGWTPYPDVYDVILGPDFRMEMVKGREAWTRHLSEQFPKEARAIQQYAKDLMKVRHAWGWVNFRNRLPAPIRVLGNTVLSAQAEQALRTTELELQSRFQDPKLIFGLAAQWGNHGLPPSQSCFGIHALIQNHYLEGGWYPEGGSNKIAESILPAIQKSGGAAHPKSEVLEILIEQGRAVGVRTATGEFRAPIIISGVGIERTYQHLVPAQARPKWASTLSELGQKATVATLFIGFKASPAQLGVRGENYWIYDSLDSNLCFARRDDLIRGVAHSAFLSFPTLKRSDIENQSHTAEVVSPVSFEAFQPWVGTPFKNRGEEYLAVKKRIETGILDLIEKHLPGFRDLVEFVEVSTPLTHIHYTGYSHGEIYGLPITRRKIAHPHLKIKSEIPGLFLTGADISGHGIAGVLMGGALTVGSIEGWGIFRRLFSNFT